MSNDHRYIVRIEGPERDIYRVLSTIPGMKNVDAMGRREDTAFDFAVEPEEGADIRREMFSRLAERNYPILSLRSSELSLEDIFLQLTRDGGVR